MPDDKDHVAKLPSQKARFWWAVLWCENMEEDWQSRIEEILQGLPYAYCIHDKDFDDGDPQESRKKHVHLLFAYGNSTTYKQALSIFKRLGENAVNTCEPVFKVRYAYNYLIHDTKECAKKRLQDDAACRKHRKHLYDRSERIEGNDFDIGLFEQLSTAERHNYIKNMDETLISGNIYDYSVAAQVFGEADDPVIFDIFLGHSAHFERMCKGIYLRACRSSSMPPPIRVQLVTKKKDDIKRLFE